jgi:hypothetical protein
MRISLPALSRASKLLLAGLLFIAASHGTAQVPGQPSSPKVTYKAMISFHGQELTGRMMFKTVSEDTVRFAFFNELGMSFVEGEVAVSGRRSAVGGQRSAVGSSRSAVSSQQSAVRSRVEIVHVASFLDYKSFRKNFGKAVLNLFSGEWAKDYGMVEEPKEFVYKKGRNFQFILLFTQSFTEF